MKFESPEEKGVVSSLFHRLRTGSSYEIGAVGVILGVIAIVFLMFVATAFFATSWFPTGLQTAHYGPNSNLSPNTVALDNSNNGSSNAGSRPSVPTPTPVLGRPETGFVFIQGSGQGTGRLDVANGLAEDAILKLRSVDSGVAYREVYIRGGDNVSISGISPGGYEVLFAAGFNYAPSVKKFLDGAYYKKFDEPFDFNQTSDGNGTRSPMYKVSLSKVPRGTVSSSITDEADFNH